MELNFKRVIGLIVRDYAENSKSFRTTVLAIIGIFVFIKSISSLGAQVVNFGGMVSSLYVAMFIGGFIYTASIFKEIHHSPRAYRFLTLPASNFEKFLYGWMLTSPLFIVVSFIIINVIALLVGIVLYMFGKEIGNFDIIANNGFGKVSLTYIFSQPIFLVGATYFKKNQFFKTILSVIVILTGIGIVSSLYGYLLFGSLDMNEAFMHSNFDFVSRFKFNFNGQPFHWTFYLLGPICLLIAYFRLKETEI
jgi:hypothetical protein